MADEPICNNDIDFSDIPVAPGDRVWLLWYVEGVHDAKPMASPRAAVVLEVGDIEPVRYHHEIVEEVGEENYAYMGGVPPMTRAVVVVFSPSPGVRKTVKCRWMMDCVPRVRDPVDFLPCYREKVGIVDFDWVAPHADPSYYEKNSTIPDGPLL